MDIKYTIALSAALLGSSVASQAVAAQGNWLPQSNGEDLPFDAIVGGHEIDGSPISVCEAYWIDPGGFVTGPHPGEIKPGYLGCQITHHESNSTGQPETPVVSPYNVLVPDWRLHPSVIERTVDQGRL
jgi:hypothetical protein